MYLWKELHFNGSIKFRGSDVITNSEYNQSTIASLVSQTQICQNFPECLRSPSSWIILGGHYIIAYTFESVNQLAQLFGADKGSTRIINADSRIDFPISITIQFALGDVLFDYFLDTRTPTFSGRWIH